MTKKIYIDPANNSLKPLVLLKKITMLALALAFIGTTNPAALAAGPPESFAPLVEKVRGAVVNISATGNITSGELDEDTEANPFPPGSPFDDFFKGMRPPGQPGQPGATGVAQSHVAGVGIYY